MKFDYTKLMMRIVEHGMTQEQVANEIDMRSSTFSMKLNSLSQFKQSEMLALKKLLKIPDEQMDEYFFMTEVQRIEH